MSLSESIVNAFEHSEDVSINANKTTAKLLINFQMTVISEDSHIHDLVLKERHMDRYSDKNRINIKISDIKKYLITYIGCWHIYVKQNVISQSDVINNIGSFLHLESIILGDAVNFYQHNPESIFNSSAHHCQELFDKCGKLSNGSGSHE